MADTPREQNELNKGKREQSRLDQDLNRYAVIIPKNEYGKRVEKETEIIKQALLKIDSDIKDIDQIIKKAEEMEKNSNQILDFTREVKNMNHEDKIQIIETLWKIIYSNNEADMFETNLMRRLGGLLYIDNKTIADIKEKIKKDNSL